MEENITNLDQAEVQVKEETPVIKEKKEVDLLEEGMALNKWLENRFKNNKNVLLAITGPTGSGKTYSALRIVEKWYSYKFEKDFTDLVETHVCFTMKEIMNLLSSGRLRKGSILIYEEAGTSLNSLDYQNKVAKLFTFILQSFRSMNVGIIYTLPVLTMLNKSARLLLHGHFITQSINPYLQVSTLKPLFHQLNQEKGKSYWKYMRVNNHGEVLTLERFNYRLPSEKIRNIYEKKKSKFVNDLAKDFSDQLDEMDTEKKGRGSKDSLTEIQRGVFEDVIENGLTPAQCAANRHKAVVTIYETLAAIKKKGFSIEKWIRYRETKSKSRVEKERERISKKFVEKNLI